MIRIVVIEREFGAGAGASRLLTGSLPPHHALEAALAAAKEAEAALLRGFFAHALLSSRLRASGGGEDPDFSVGEDAVDVHQDQADLRSAGGDFGADDPVDFGLPEGDRLN